MSNYSTGTQYLNNTVTSSGSGVHTDNNGVNGGTADLIQGNTVSDSPAGGGYGIFVFAPKVAATVRDNTITNVDVALASAGQQAAVAPIFENNLVDGQAKPNSVGFYITTSEFGWGDTDVAATFTSNTITGTTTGIVIEQTTDTNKITLTAHFNRIVGNTTGVKTAFGNDVNGTPATTWNSSNSINVEDNWWGCNAGPGNSGCDSVNETASGTGTVIFNPWLVLGISATPTTVAASGGTSSVVADLVHDSNGADTSALGHLPDATAASFTATLGTMSPNSSGTASGYATSTFTAGATQGTATLGATVDSQTVQTTVAVANPVPVITSLSPSSVLVGTAGPVTLTVTGSNFVDGASIQYGGASLYAFFNDSTSLSTILTTTRMATAGVIPVTVTNPAPAGGTSNIVNFTVNNPQPVLTSMSPTQVAPGGPGFTLTLNGSSFVNNAVVYWTASSVTTPLATAFVNATQITAAVPGSLVETAGSATVQVKNPAPNLGDSGTLTFTISAPNTAWVNTAWTGPYGTSADGHTIGYDAFATITDGVRAVAAGGTVNVYPGTYAENLTLAKALALVGNFGAAPQPVIQSLGSGSNADLLLINSAGVSISNFQFEVDLKYYRNGIRAASGAFTGIVIQNSLLHSYNSNPNTAPPQSSWPYNGINLGGGTAGSGAMVTVINNEITATPTVVGGFPYGVFGRGVWLYQVNGTVSGNTIYAFRDVLTQFATGGGQLIQNNNFTGGGLDVTEPNPGLTNRAGKGLAPSRPALGLAKPTLEGL